MAAKTFARRTIKISEIMTSLIYFHQSHYRNFKAYYTEHVCQQLKAEFPNLVSYERFVVLTPSVSGPLSAYLKVCTEMQWISFVDSTALEVCDPHRIHNHKVFEELPSVVKGSMGWFYGLKLHLSSMIVAKSWLAKLHRNIDDRKPFQHLQTLIRKLVADRGYISQPLFEHC